MKIEVVIKKDLEEKQAEKNRGDLLEKITGDLLKIRNYEVFEEVRRTGVELDLVCKNKANRSKDIYIECKAYNDKKIQSGVITSLSGIRGIYQYEEAWLVTTSSLGKEAKGLVDKISSGDDKKSFTFYTPDKLVDAFVDANIIVSTDVAKSKVNSLIQQKNKIDSDLVLLVTEYGKFWAVKYLKGGKPSSVILVYASDGEIVKEKDLIDNIYNTDNSLKDLNFYLIQELLGEEYKDTDIKVQDIRLNEEYHTKIEDVGIRFTHPDKNELFLEDIFVYPDLQGVGNDDSEKLNSSKLINLKEEYKKCIIFGEDISGKTSLAYYLQKNLNIQDKVALYFDAEDIKRPDLKSFSNLFTKNFEKQYSDKKAYTEAAEKIYQNDTSKCVILIDNFERFAIKREESQVAFFKELNDKFENIFIFANKSIEIEALAKAEFKEMFQGFKMLTIKQFGHALRDELIERWITVANQDTVSDSDVLNKKRDMAEKIRIAVGTNFVPTFPLYLLTMLQLIEAGNKHNLQGSSYAELYRCLINQNLKNVNAKPEDFDFYHTYLSFIAFHFFINEKKELSEEEIIKVYENYALQMDIKTSFNEVHELLIKAKLFKKESGFYQFIHSYSYYFFVAKYLSDNLETEIVKAQIDKITKKLYRSEYANIIIFLIHHSKNKDIINRILNESNDLFRQISPYTFSANDTQSFNALIQEEVKLLIEDKNPSDIRKKELQHRDKFEEDDKKKKKEEPNCNDVSSLDLFGKINLGFKLMEILGQITNNYYGSLNSDQKVEILDEVYSLGFRSLRALLEDVEKYLGSLKEEVNDFVEKKKDLTFENKEKAVNNIVYGFVEMMAIVFLKKTSDSMASTNLTLSIDKVVNKNNTPASKLVGIATQLNFPNGLDISKILDLNADFVGNFMLRDLLRFLVVEHLYKFDVNYADKQRVCDKLGIGINMRRQLIQSKK